MKVYVEILSEIIDHELSKGNKFNLIKFENFTTPEIYLRVCNYYKNKFEDHNLNFIFKLSKEKYSIWNVKNEMKIYLDKMEINNYIEKEDNLTKWRNYAFKNMSDDYNIFLMGTEAIEDKGGLEEFYKISPEIIERYIGNNYDVFLKKLGFSYDDDEYENFNCIIESIFKYVPKDLLKLSNLLEKESAHEINYYQLIDDILSNLYLQWGIPNIKGVTKKESEPKKCGSIIETAYKFSRRIGLEYSSEKKVQELSNKIDDYYETYKSDINNEFNYLFSSYNDYNDFKNDLINYCKGVNIDSIKPRLFTVDFKAISKVIKMKKKGKTKKTSKTPIIKGEPFKALFTPILAYLGDIDLEERAKITEIELDLSNIKLSGTKSKDNLELKTKWGNLCIFLGGIENLINNLYITNNHGEEITVSIISKVEKSGELINKYPFNRDNITDLINSGILESGSNNDTKSKISIEYTFRDTEENILDETQFEWHFYDNDVWVNTFSMFNCNKFIDLISKERVLPVSISDAVDEMVDSISEGELFYLINNKSFEYKNIYEDFSIGSLESVITNNIATLFSKAMNDINKNGFFNCYNNKILVDFLFSYSDFCLKLKEKIQKNHIENDTATLLSKLFMLLNYKELKEKYIIGAVIPPYHPVMLERIIDRYRYLSNGFKEIFDQIKGENEIKPNEIYSRFDRFSQLSTVTSSIDFMIGQNNNYIGQKRTLGYYTIFGESHSSYCGSSNDVLNFIDEEDDESAKENTPISKNICKIVKDYIKTYPSKIDGVRVAFYEPNEYKDIISGLNNAVKELKKEDKIKIQILIDVYTSDFRCKGANYFRYWIENNFDEEDDIRIESSIKYMDISNQNNLKQYIDNTFTECDIVFVNNVMTYKSISEDNIGVDIDSDSLANSKYPTVQLPLAANSERNRRVIISQPQFKCSNDFSQLMVFVNSKIAKEGNYQGVKTVALEETTQDLLVYLNEKSTWVVVMDENIDKKIVEMTGNKIISFATGKGYFGELNLAISTKNQYLVDLERFLQKRLKRKFPEWTSTEALNAAKLCVNYSKTMDGAQIIKAINPSDEAINEYLAFLLTTKILSVDKNDDKFYIRKLISVDSHLHLFNEKLGLNYVKDNIPDFMLFEIKKEINDLNDKAGNIKIGVTLIECKLAQENDMHLNKAKQQISSGYFRLKQIWDNDEESVQDRYWFNQLYRLLVYNNEVNSNIEECNEINSKLFKINERAFEISFNNKILTYWLDSDFENYMEKSSEVIDDIEIHINKIGKRLIKDLLVNHELDVNVFINDSETNIVDKQVENVIELEKVKAQTKKEYKEIEVVHAQEEIAANIDIKVERISDSNNSEYEAECSKKNVLDLFNNYENNVDDDEVNIVQKQVERLKKEFYLRDIKIFIKDFTIGPDIVRISIEPGVGVDYSKISKHLPDMQIWLAINEEPSIFKEDGYIKIDFARKNRQIVSFKECVSKTIENEDILKNKEDKLYVLLGADILGNPKVIDLSDSNNPHLLVAGQTGSGKSVLLASMLTSMMVYYTPQELEFLLVDPKVVELTVFEESPFTKLTTTEADEVQSMLKEVVDEMHRRYKLFKAEKVQNIAAYNKKVSIEDKLKRIVVVIDEYGVLMESGKEFVKEFETYLKKLSQLARAAGIHLIICTQSPKADIITTTIRNNLPARIGLKVADSNASSLVLDGSGCEKLLGKGDMLLKTADSAIPTRCKSPFIDQEEIRNLNNYYSIDR